MCRYHNVSTTSHKIDPYRLPRIVLPQRYDVRLAPDMRTGKYTGDSNITVTVAEPTDEIVLNAITYDDLEEQHEKVIDVYEATVTNDRGTTFEAVAVPNPATQRVHIKVKGRIGKGTWHARIKYNGFLNDKLKGFYRSVYKDEDGTEHTIATTQFESTDARRAFPCFDEPDMKAKFKLSLEVDESLATISNSRIVRETLIANSRKVHEEYWTEKGPAGETVAKGICEEIIGTGKKLVEFAETPTLSTYLYAFVVGNLVATKPVMVDGVAVRVWCRPGKEHLTKFALKIAQFSLRYYKKYFGVAYPFDKLDMLAIPDFNAGAMENAGCVTFRESALLVDEATASQGALDYVAHVVAHELAHMWFGDLVTMRWWNGLWLNEAFATLMENKCVNAWKREWLTWDNFGTSRAMAFDVDSLKSTRAIEGPVLSAADAEAMFDGITYEKGCAVLRMLETFMGEDTFQKGIAAYIQKHAWGNTDAEDLWAALSQASGLPVAEIMHSWVFTPGFPVVSIEADGEGAITIKQQQFKFLKEAVDETQLWQVPIMLRVKTAEGVREMKHLLTAREETIYVGEGLEWVVANAGGNGFYRTLYSDALRNKLTANPRETLCVIERFNIVNDAWAGVQSGLSSSLAFITLVKLMAGETDPNVWSGIIGPLAKLKGLLPKGQRDAFAAMVHALVSPALAAIGWQPKEGESTQQGELRGTLISALALTANDKPAQDQAEELFKSWKADKHSVDGDILKAVVSTVAANGDEADFKDFLALFKAAASPEEEGLFRSALSGFRNGDILKQTLALCLNPGEIRTQDSPSMIARIIASESCGEYAWQFAKESWDKLCELYPSQGLVSLCNGVTSLTTAALEADVKDFLDKHPIVGGEALIGRLLERQRINRLVREREAPVLAGEFIPAPVTQ